MKEIAFRIAIFPISEIDASDPAPWEHSSGHVFFSYDMPLEPSRDVSDAGQSYDMSLNLTIDLPSEEDRKLFSISRSCVVAFFDSDRITHVFGNRELPLQVGITSYLSRAKLMLEGKVLAFTLS